ncbi:CPBP family glutamic-type intramembrane protease, partial [Agathobacter rectalis]|uniref:CPBP family glutamic-type intramembrane protease n=1 Tax=Agathobacter rectalis TaxID=39491 RepID=UPI0027F66C73|nr:CPBP family intramembrane metalloprotease [Agathobacter rectalis]
QAVPAVIMGGLFAYFYIKTDNIAVPVAMHAFFNTSGELTQFISTAGMCSVYSVIGILILITLLTAKRRDF